MSREPTPALGTIPEAKALDVREILGGETLLTPDEGRQCSNCIYRLHREVDL